jgi:hypothetical protein
MALTRKMLKAMGIEDEKVEQIIEAHTETVTALKDERDAYKADAEKLPTVQKELDELKATDGKEDTYKVKYEAVKEEFESFKREQKEKETKAKKVQAYKALLQEAGVSEKRIDAVLKVSDVNSVEFDEDGNVKDADTLKKSIVSEWEDFIVHKETQGTQTSNPPSGSGKVYKSKDEIMAIKDTAERQKAMVDNHELFGI